MPEPRRNAAGDPVNDEGVRICGSATRWCVCGPKPTRTDDDEVGHHQKGHVRDHSTGTRRGRCQRDACACTAFDPYPCDITIGLYPNGRCHRHGGPALTGVAAPGWRGRGVSRVLPERLLNHYNEAMDDPNLLSLRQEIALQRALLNDLLVRLQEGHHVPGAAFVATGALGKAWRGFEAAYRAGDADRIGTALRALDEAVRAVQAAMQPERVERDLRTEVRSTTLNLERLARSENSRLTELHNMVTAERALALQHASVQALLDVLAAHVPDVQTRSAIRRDVAARLQVLVRGGGAGGDLPPASGGS